jgi:hypothetical protein
MFGVGPKTVTRWCVEGRLASFKTLGGHRRISVQTLFAVLCEMGMDDDGALRMVASAR